jgi:iron complex outermembrane receptor protein
MIALSVALFCFPAYAANATEKDAETIEYLKSLDFSQLMEVEVSLDDVFDVFDGLVNRRKVKVASGVEQSMARAPAVTSVITAQDIEATGADNLDEVLQMVPGLHVSRDNLYNPIYSIRGLYSLTNPETLVMINGIPIKDLAAGNRGSAWGGMPLHNVARIEVIRGPGSAVYGADAFSGAINIITKQVADIDGTEMGARVGSFDTYEAWMLHSDAWGDVAVAVALEWRDTKGHAETVTADRQSALDRQTGSSASFAPGAVELERRWLDAHIDLHKDHWRLRAGYQGRPHNGTGAGGAQSLDPIGYLSDARYNVDLSYHNPVLTKNWDVKAQLSLIERDFASNDVHLFPAGTRLPFPQQPNGVVYPNGVRQSHDFSQRYTTVAVDSFYRGLRNHVLRLGAGYAVQDLYDSTYFTNRGIGANGKPIPPHAGMVELTGTPAIIIPTAKRKNLHAFIQDTWAFYDSWEVTAGIRYDDYSDFGTTINPRAALVWQTSSKLTTKLLYGQAFRAPSFRELYVFNNVYRGNKDLTAEEIETWEVAFDYRASDSLNLAANLFSYEVSDKILFVPLPDSNLLSPENYGNQEGYGMEFEARWKMSAKSSLMFNYAYANSESDNADIGNYPHHSAYLRSDWLLAPNWYLNAQANWVADRSRPPADMGLSETADYVTVDLTLRHKDINAKTWNFAFGARNIFDTDAREPISRQIPGDLPQAGRSFFAELRYRF